jgi:hypothetical protein
MDDNWFSTGPFVPWGFPDHFMDRAEARSAVEDAIEKCDAAALGRSLHSFQDSYSHRHATPYYPIGHGIHSVLILIVNYVPAPGPPIADPDDFNPSGHSDLADRDREMAHETEALLERFRCKCGQSR